MVSLRGQIMQNESDDFKRGYEFATKELLRSHPVVLRMKDALLESSKALWSSPLKSVEENAFDKMTYRQDIAVKALAAYDKAMTTKAGSV